MRYSNHFCTLRAEERQADAAPMLWFTDSKTPRLLNSLHRGKRGSLGLEWSEGLLYQTPGTFSQHTLLEALIVRGGSASYFGEQQRDLLLLYLYQKLDENNSSNQQVHIAVQQYIQYTMVCSHVASNSVLFAESGDTTSLFANKEGSSSERRMEGGIADETSMPPLKCECFGSAA